ncbi:MAG: hypothetical protein IJZ86_03280 [Bacteroides sp.]|nr:hypothetical protein [Bacteroides sp.]
MRILLAAYLLLFGFLPLLPAQEVGEGGELSIPSVALLSPEAVSPTARPVLQLPAAPFFWQGGRGVWQNYSTGGLLQQFRRGWLSGANSRNILPGIGQINQAELGYQHLFHTRWSLQLSATAENVQAMQWRGNSLGLSGNLLYQATDHLSFRLFGAYHTRNPFATQGAAYGGSLIYAPTHRFSLEMGLQHVQDPVTGEWTTRPMLIPTYHFNKVSLGLDVGSLLYELLRRSVQEKPSHRSAGTIAPPRPDFHIAE